MLSAHTRTARNFTGDDVCFVQAAAIARLRGENALRLVEARYRRIAANTPGVVYQYHIHPGGALSIPFISESCRTLYGREPAEIQAHPEIMLESIHEEDRAGIRGAIRAAEATLAPLHWQGRLGSVPFHPARQTGEVLADSLGKRARRAVSQTGPRPDLGTDKR